MFEVGFTEILLILGIGLLVLGPQKLPRVAAQVGRWAGRARAMARNLKDQLDEEVHRAEQAVKDPITTLTPSAAPTSPIAAAAASLAASGAAAETGAAPAATATDDFAHRDDPYLRDGDEPEPAPPAVADAASAPQPPPAADDGAPRP